jgi:hypothetical protein
MERIDELSERFWAWRSSQQPRTRDDIPRLTRPDGWLPEVGHDALERHRAQLAQFRAELAGVDPAGLAEVADRVDHRLLRSALARVHWELDVVRLWRLPRYYLDQAVGPVFDALLRPRADAARAREVTRLLHAVPAVVDQAKDVLVAGAAAEFAALAVSELTGIDARLHRVTAALARVDPEVDGGAAAALHAAAATAGTALLDYRSWLVARMPHFGPAEPVGRTAYEWFLTEVACIPLDADRIRQIGRIEADRAAVMELLHRNRFRMIPVPYLPADADAQARREERDVDSVGRFYESEGLLSRPPGLRRYLNAPMPSYLEPLRFLGVTNDLTGPDRLDEDAVSYVPDPKRALPYFYAANARDPRLGIVHEGVHYQQLAWSWSHPRPVRRHYYDSGSNEGIAFYNEELMLAAGLFDDAPHSRTTAYNMMRLRALRVELDVGLAVGDLDLEAAAALLRTTVPMDAETAQEEAAFFAESPGQALTYQVGKTQLMALLADASRLLGERFDLRAMHDAIWLNGNVPIALLRWELLGLTDELAAIGVTP